MDKMGRGKTKMKRKIVSAIFLIAVAIASSGASTAMAAGEKYVGNLACKDCHKELYASWENSLHAKVFDLLKPNVRADKKKEVALKPDVDYTTDRSCMNCHVTGLGAGGFSLENPKEEWKGVGCEECHGPAEKWLLLHEKKNLKKRARKLKQAGLIDPFKGKTVCMRCHGNRNSPYNAREINTSRDWTDLEWAKTYHMVPEPGR